MALPLNSQGQPPWEEGRDGGPGPLEADGEGATWSHTEAEPA